MNSSGIALATKRLIDAHRGSVVGTLPGATANRSATAISDQGTLGTAKTDFSMLFEAKCNEIRFSAHAASRIKSRNIAITPETLGKLSDAVDHAANKGARDSLILMKNNAFIVNIPNRMVVTAMDGAGLKENIFTNIDSAVIVD